MGGGAAPIIGCRLGGMGSGGTIMICKQKNPELLRIIVLSHSQCFCSNLECKTASAYRYGCFLCQNSCT